jgi:hypothetical protein
MPDTLPCGDPAHHSRQPSIPRWVWAFPMLLLALIFGGVAGVLAYAAEPSVPMAILTGGGSTATATVVMVALAHYLTGGQG